METIQQRAARKARESSRTRKILDVIVVVTLPITIPLAGLAIAFGIGIAMCVVLPLAIVTLPIWLPIKVYFTEVWHADERARRAAAELAVQNLLEDNRDPRLRRGDGWWITR